MFCKYCGNQVNDTSKFCSTCGKPLFSDAQPAPTIGAPREKETTDEHPKEAAIRILRKTIINTIHKTPATTYELSSLLWDDAARCFPTNYGFHWDGAWFKLNLLTKELYADVSTYPNQYGASREDKYHLTAEEFHQKTLEFTMAKELQHMETESDWHALFDGDLNAAVARAQSTLKEQQEKQKQALRISHGIVIPDEFAAITPTMEFDTIRIELHQRYGMSSGLLGQIDGKYIVVSSGNRRELSPKECAWVERQVKDCIQNPSQETWQSAAGGDYMSVKISTTDAILVDLFYKTPFKKYYDLKHLLQTLATYGSLTESEKKKSEGTTQKADSEDWENIWNI